MGLLNADMSKKYTRKLYLRRQKKPFFACAKKVRNSFKETFFMQYLLYEHILWNSQGDSLKINLSNLGLI